MNFNRSVKFNSHDEIKKFFMTMIKLEVLEEQDLETYFDVFDFEYDEDNDYFSSITVKEEVPLGVYSVIFSSTFDGFGDVVTRIFSYIDLDNTLSIDDLTRLEKVEKERVKYGKKLNRNNTNNFTNHRDEIVAKYTEADKEVREITGSY